MIKNIFQCRNTTVYFYSSNPDYISKLRLSKFKRDANSYPEPEHFCWCKPDSLLGAEAWARAVENFPTGRGLEPEPETEPKPKRLWHFAWSRSRSRSRFIFLESELRWRSPKAPRLHIPSSEVKFLLLSISRHLTLPICPYLWHTELSM